MEISINNGEFLWSHGLISDQTYQLDQNVCNTSRMWLEDYVIGKESQACMDVYKREIGEIGNVNNYDVIADNCLAAQADQAVQTTASGKLGKLQKKVSSFTSMKSIRGIGLTDMLHLQMNKFHDTYIDHCD